MTSEAAMQSAPLTGSLADAIAEFQAGMLPTIPGDVLQTMQQAGARDCITRHRKSGSAQR